MLLFCTIGHYYGNGMAVRLICGLFLGASYALPLEQLYLLRISNLDSSPKGPAVVVEQLLLLLRLL